MIKQIQKLFIFLLFVFILILPFNRLVFAEVPFTINYQGRLSDSSGTPLSGSYDVRFRLYSDASKTTLLWGPEEHDNINVDNGYFSVALGSIVSFDSAGVDFTHPLYLTLEIKESSSATWDPETDPPVEFNSYAFALNSHKVESPSGLVDVGNTIQGGGALTGSENALYINTGTGFSGNLFLLENDGTNALVVNSQGDLGLGTANPSYDFHLYRDLDEAVGLYINNVNTGANARNRLILGDLAGDYAMLNQYPGSDVFNIRNSGQIGFFIAGTDATNDYFNFSTANSNASALRITNSGLVGLSVADPLAQLDIQPTSTEDALRIRAITGTGTGILEFMEDDNTNYIGLRAPSSIANDVVLTLPSDAGSNNQVLATDGSGTLFWRNVASRNMIIDNDDDTYVTVEGTADNDEIWINSAKDDTNDDTLLKLTNAVGDIVTFTNTGDIVFDYSPLHHIQFNTIRNGGGTFGFPSINHNIPFTMDYDLSVTGNLFMQGGLYTTGGWTNFSVIKFTDFGTPDEKMYIGRDYQYVNHYDGIDLIVHGGDANQDNNGGQHGGDLFLQGGLNDSGVRDGHVFIQDIQFPDADGNANDLLATDGAGHLIWIPSSTFTNIYTDDGSILSDRTVTVPDNMNLTFSIGNGANLYFGGSNGLGGSGVAYEMEMDNSYGYVGQSVTGSNNGNSAQLEIWADNADQYIAMQIFDGNSNSADLYIKATGAEYDDDYSALNTTNPRWIPDKAYVDNAVNNHVANAIWDSDSDTGIQVEESADEDYIRMDTAGTERLVIDNSGNVNFGTGVNSINWTRNQGGVLNTFLITNTDDASNYSGAVFSVKGSGPDYTNNVYFGKYGDGFYITSWAGNGVMATDQDLVIASVGETDATNPNPDPLINFQLGGGYNNPHDAVYLTADAFTYLPYGTNSGETFAVKFRELSANGNNSVGFKAPDSILNDVVWTLPASDGSNGQVLTTDGSGNLSWTTVSGGSSTVNSVNLTSSTYDGNFSSNGLVGYEAANDICNTEFAGSHFCRTDEIISYIEQHGASAFTDGTTAWIAEGPPGYTSNSNDCHGWTSNDSSYLGAFWEFNSNGGGMGWLTNCAVTKPLACCN